MIRKLMILATVLGWSAPGFATEVVNVYSARHYDTDDEVYRNFTKKTGIKVNLIEGSSDALLSRLRREEKLSPADVFITVDAGRLYHAEQKGVFASIESTILSQRVPANLRHPKGMWFGLTKRARIILYAKDRVKPGEITSYEDLADSKWKNRILIRSSSNVYNQSLVGSIIKAHGEKAAEKWCRGLVANMARKPQGGDRDQIRAVAAGEGDLAVANSYYYARMLSGSAKDRAAASKVAALFPNQKNRGTHVNLSGAGVVDSAPNRANAIKFIEYLTTDDAQKIFAAGNHEYPVVKGVKIAPVLEKFGPFEEDTLNVSVFGSNNQAAVRMMDRAGWR